MFEWIVEKAKIRWDKVKFSHSGNEKSLENRVNQNKEFYDRVSVMFMDNLRTQRSNLLVLSWWLIAFLSFAYNAELTKIPMGIDLAFKVGFVAIFLSIFFAIILSVVISILDAYVLKQKIQFIEKFHIQISEYLWKIRKTEFTAKQAEEYNSMNNAYSDELKKLNSFTLMTIDFIANTGFILSLMVWMISFIIHYSWVMGIWK